MSLLEGNNLNKVYGEGGTKTIALDDVSFSIKKGEFVAIMGPSGSGKSTLLHILGFLDRQSGGDYKFDGQSLANLSDDELAHIRNSQMGFIFQFFNLLSRMTVLDNVALPRVYAGTSESEARQAAAEALKSVGLEHRFDHEPNQLSGGEKQRAAIARALVNDPLVIFADEPTGNLDSKSGEVVMDILEDLNNQGRTVVLITHETYTAEYAERIIRLKDGRLESETKVAHRRTKGNFIK